VALVVSALLFLLVLARAASVASDLARTEARWRSLVSNATDLIVVLDTDLNATYLSPSAQRSLDQRVDRVALTALVHPDDLRQLRKAINAIIDEPGAGSLVDVQFPDTQQTWRRYAAVLTNRLSDPAVRGIVLNLRDVTDRTALETQLRHLALHDPLTGLPNRLLFTDRVRHALSNLERTDGQLAVLFIDLDGFKAVNDTFGHAAGDQLLITVADRIRGCLRPADSAARLGGDEFAILIPDLADRTDAEQIAQRLLTQLRRPVSADAQVAMVGASIGIASGTAATTAHQILLLADQAMYAAKRAGKNGYAHADAAPCP
jgi:diguanylate cyclase (GGDEF)-like protein/PAS domain S-box-containing protein